MIATDQHFVQRVDPFTSVWTRVFLVAMWIAFFLFLGLFAAGGEVGGIIFCGLGLTVLLGLTLLSTGSPRICPGESIGGGTLLRRVRLNQDEAVYFDAAAASGDVMGHVVITRERVLIVPYRLSFGSLRELRISDVVEVTPGTYRLGGFSWGNVRIATLHSTLALRGWTGADWMGAYDPNDLARDLRAALGRAGWRPPQQ